MEAGGNELRVDVPNAWPANLFYDRVARLGGLDPEL